MALLDPIDKAESVLFRIIQFECFHEEFAYIKAGKPVKNSPRLMQFQPFLDEHGKLRAKRRLQRSELDFAVKFPIVLADHWLIKLLLRYTHESRLHQGVEGSVAFINQKFLIICCRKLLRSTKSSCVVCHRYDASTASELSPPLPEDRLTFQRPFSAAGVDHIGPLFIKSQSQRIERNFCEGMGPFVRLRRY